DSPENPRQPRHESGDARARGGQSRRGVSRRAFPGLAAHARAAVRGGARSASRPRPSLLFP
ncbi:MAG: hypothetical protein AVDCRST_MAG26-4586, partial [uncultured Chloroflexia bacterium]